MSLEVREPTPDLSTVTEGEWEKGARRSKVIRRLFEKNDRTLADVVSAAAQLGCSVDRVYVLLRRFRADPTVTGLLNRRSGPVTGTSRLSPEIEKIIDEAIETTYLTKQKIRVADLVREIQRRCRARGLPPPSRKAVWARVQKKPQRAVIGRREGGCAARSLLAPVLGCLEASGPLAPVQIDHTLVDVIVVDSITRTPIQRPWLTIAIDVYSRCVAGFHLSLETPSATSVALCISHAALPKESWLATRNIEVEWPVSGIMSGLHLDNAKEFHSEALRRGCAQHGITLEYRPVRTPHYGGHIERLIGTLMGKVHLLPGTTYSNIQAKGASDPQKTASMTLPEVEHWLAHAIAGIYHRSLHKGIGKPPLIAWQNRDLTGYHERAVADPRRFLIDFLPMERR